VRSGAGTGQFVSKTVCEAQCKAPPAPTPPTPPPAPKVIGVWLGMLRGSLWLVCCSLVCFLFGELRATGEVFVFVLWYGTAFLLFFRFYFLSFVFLDVDVDCLLQMLMFSMSDFQQSSLMFVSILKYQDCSDMGSETKCDKLDPEAYW
jgi:hypothetical protein